MRSNTSGRRAISLIAAVGMLLGLATILPPAADAGNGSGILNPSYGTTNGFWHEDTGGIDLGRAGVLDSQGRLLVTGESNTDGTNFTDEPHLTVVRRLPNGQRDTSYNNHFQGAFIAPDNFVNHKYSSGRDIAIDGLGNAIVAGVEQDKAQINHRGIVVRFTPTGQLDATFGKTSVDVGGDANTVLRTVAVDSSGGYIAAGDHAGNQLVFVRLTPSGSYDPNFGNPATPGHRVISVPSGTVNDIKVAPDGSILFVGAVKRADRPDADVLIGRLTADGTLDSSFSVAEGGLPAGLLAVGSPAGLRDSADALTLLPDGRAYAAGTTFAGATSAVNVVALRPTGVLDSSFGSGGMIVDALVRDINEGRGIAVDANDRILVLARVVPDAAVPSGGDAAVVRYLPSGRRDADYGTGNGMGTVNLAVGAIADSPEDLVIEPTGRADIVSGHIHIAVGQLTNDGPTPILHVGDIFHVAGSVGEGIATQQGITATGIAAGGGAVFIADNTRNVVQRVDLAANTIEPFFGNAVLRDDLNPPTAPFLASTFNTGEARAAALDRLGNVYVGGRGGRVYRVNAAGVGMHVAGTNAGFAGDGGPATAARLEAAVDIAPDPTTDYRFYVAEPLRIRRIDPSGTISTIAGTGTAGYGGDGGAATAAQFNQISGIDVLPNGDVLVADSLNGVIRKITVATGVITTVAGHNAAGPDVPGDGGQATVATLQRPDDVAAFANGDYVIADALANVIRRVNGTTGVIDTVAGGRDITADSGDGGPATAARFRVPNRVAVSGSNVYVGDLNAFKVRRFTLGGNIGTIAGTGIQGRGGDGGLPTAKEVQLTGPQNLAINDAGELFISERGVGTGGGPSDIRRIATNGSTGNPEITTFGGAGPAGFADGPLATARFNSPSGMAFGPDGTMYVADQLNHRIRTIKNGVVATYAGTATAGFSGDGGLATAAQFFFPRDVAVAPDGTVYVADMNNHRIRAIDPVTKIITTVAGTGDTPENGDNQPATSANLHFPRDVAVHPLGGFVIADEFHGRYRRVMPDGTIVPFVSSPTATANFTDGMLATDINLGNVRGLTIGNDGTTYFATIAAVYSVDAAGRLHRVAGNGVGGYSGDNGPATLARLVFANDVALSNDGTLYIVDSFTHRVRAVRVLPQPVPAVAGPGMIAFSAQKLGPGQHDVLVMREDGSQVTNLTYEDPDDAFSPRFSPDASRIAFNSHDGSDYDLVVMNPDGTGKRTVCSVSGEDDNSISWSPDGTRFAFASQRGGQSDLYVCNPGTSGTGTLTRLTNDAQVEAMPNWSPDGTTLAIETEFGGAREIATMPATGGPKTNRTNTIFNEFRPVWSPDGKTIAYENPGAGDSTIWMMNADGTNQHQVTVDPGGPSFGDAIPEFSPDGSRIMFTRQSGGTLRIGHMALDGTGIVWLSAPNALDASGDWVNNLQAKAAAPEVQSSPARVPLSQFPLQPTAPNVLAAGPLSLGGLLPLPGPLSLGGLLPLPGPLSLGGLLPLGPLSLGGLLPLPGPLSLGGLLPLPYMRAALDIPLSTIPPADLWERVIAGTELDKPLQSVTLWDVFNNSTTYGRLQQEQLGAVVLSGTPLGALGAAGYLLGNLPLAAYHAPQVSCAFFEAQGQANCGQALNPQDTSRKGLGLSPQLVMLAGLDTAPLRLHAVAFKDIDWAQGDAPLLRVKLGRQNGGVDLSLADIGSMTMTQLGNRRDAAVNCSGNFVCDPNRTLADAQQAGALKPNLTLGAIETAVDAFTIAGTPIPVGQLLVMLLPPNLRPYGVADVEQLGLAGYAGADGEPREQTINVSYAPVGVSDLDHPTITVTPAAGAPFIPGTATIAASGGSGSAIAPTVVGNTLTFTPAVNPAAGSTLTLSFKIRPGLRVGPASLPSVEITGPAAHQRDDRTALHTVTDNSFDTGSVLASAKAIKPAIIGTNGQEGEAAFLFVTDKDDHQLLTFPAPPAGSRIHVDVEHLAFDADVALYQAPGSTGLRPVRPFAATPGVTPVTDRATSAVASGNLLSPEAKQDFPFLLTDRVVAGFGNNRGNSDEAVDAYAVDADPGSNYVLQISGYNGAFSAKAFTVRVRITLPVDLGPCPAREFPNVFSASSRGTAPASVPDGTRSVILTNRSRLQRLYGEAGAQQVMDQLGMLAAHPDVKGLVVPVDGWSSTDAAYNAFDATPCDPLAANAVNRAINTEVDNLFGAARSQLQFVTLVGSDDVIPHTRAVDLTERVNEQTFAEAAKTGGANNARSGAFAQSYLLTDDGYADWAPEPWLGAAFYLADVAVGRLVETPAEIAGAIDRALQANLTLQPSTAFTTGYEFLADGAAAVDAALERALGAPQGDAVNDTWTAQNVKDQLAADRVVAVNAHATPSSFLPGAGLPELTAGDVSAADIARTLLISMGCHVNLNLPDATVGVPDFAQASSKGAGLVGNTGYGIGYVNGIGLTESVMVEFANRLKQMSIGQALAFGKQAYRATEAIDNVWSAKSLEIAGLSGIPQLHLSGATSVPTPTSGRAVGVDPVSGRNAERVTLGGGLQYHRNDVNGESWYDYQGHTVQLAGRAVQPEIVEPVLNGATDALITDLVTRVADDNLDPLVAVMAIVGGGTLREDEPEDPSAAIAASVKSFRATDGDHQQLNVVAGQFLPRGVVAGEVVGQQRVVDGMTVAVLNGNGASDGHRPVITSTRGSVVDTGGGQNATFEVEAYDVDGAGAKRPVAGGIVLSIEAGPGSMDGAWHRTALTPDPSNPYRLTGAVPGVTAEKVQYFVQVWDGQLVGVSTSKDAFYQAVALPPPPPDSPLQASAAGAAAGGGFLQSATITISPAEGAHYRIDNGEEQPYTGPFTITTEGVHQIDVHNDVDATTIIAPVDNAPPTVVTAPAAPYQPGQQVPTTDVVACRDAGSGVKRCEISPATIDTSPGGPEQRSQNITVTSEDFAGHTITRTVTYQYTVTAGGSLSHEIIGTALPGGFYENPLIRLTPTSGTEYRVNNGTWVAYSSPFPVGPPDGVYTVDYRNGSRTGQVVVKVDANAPTTTLAARRSYEMKASAPTAALVTCADQPAGVKRCEVSPPSLQTNTVGTGKTQTLHIVAEDNAGHVVTRDLVYTYDVGYRFEGFFSPIANAPTVNAATAGQTFPVKFKLRDGTGALVTNVNQATVTVTVGNFCGTSQPQSTATGSAVATDANKLKWDSTTQQYVYNWQTQKAWAKTCREFKFVLPDGVSHVAYFNFK